MIDNKLVIFKRILEEIRGRKERDKPFVIGITGIDTSGKTRFAELFETFLLSAGLKTQLIKLDDFHNPKKIRYSGDDQADNYYHKSFDLKTITEKLLKPVKQKISYSVKLVLLDLLTDKYEVEKTYSFDKDTIIIFEGVFLFKAELSPYIDFKIFLDVPFEEVKKRAKERDVPIYGEGVLIKYDSKYLPAQRRYLNEFPPERTADLIIDNLDWEHPKIRFIKSYKNR